ncbi:PadR family transcriptional regulator [Luteipulveratus mongoliensis]|uniref:Transcription regulator PadR N-terminal domain-containing protein n=1 Tax=Luteipulveratus mongoliensis TaxID=571913 RepID=A0A0K1JIZ6_9MICO|nr:PadR family transcriptional regulator [Luteipulveratus mongoliensis]AKU16694.1 hypothetical protein VV02_13835 [Luteipulveratus mongoliensis]
MPVRLTTASYLVLGLVDMLGEASPYALKQAAADYVAPFWSLPHTQIYVQADKLVESGLLRQDQETDGRRRRILTITEEGREALNSWRADPTAVPVEARDLGLLKLFFGADSKVIGPAQVEHHSQRLAGYEEMKAGGSRMPDGAAATLEFGIRYERALVAFWSTLLEVRKPRSPHKPD